jgi:hypothetical protein
MWNSLPVRTSLAILAAGALSCSPAQPKVTRADALALLQQEAQKMKADGEKVPDVGVKATWNIAGVDVVEEPGNAAQPFRGTIRFRIESATHAIDGPATQSFEKRFDYVYDAAQKRWLFKM